MHTDSKHGYSQSLPLKWLHTPEEWDRQSLLEFVRGSLCSLSSRDNASFEAVHVSRIQRLFERLGAPGLHRVGLRLLELLREAEPLFGGYWLPTPYRVIEIERELVFIGAIPNAHGFLGEARSEGLCRLLAQDIADRFPRQSLESWMGGTSPDPLTVVAEFKAKHALVAAKTSNLSEVQYLSIAPSRAMGYPRFQWGDRAIAVLPVEQIAICRQSSRGRIRYFSATLRREKLAAEAPIDIAVQRLLFAIARHVGAPVKTLIRPGQRGTEIAVDERLPIEEFRLSLLLSRKIVRTGRSTTFVLPPTLAKAFAARLAILGCAMESMQ